MRILTTVLLASLAACGPKPDAAVPGDSSAVTDSAVLPGNEPVSLAEVPPGDTAAILRVMRGTMSDIDGMLGQLERRDTTLPPVDPEEARRLSVWVRDGVPRKLTVTEPNDAGAMTGESHYWLVGGELRVVQQPFAGYVLYGDRILVWTDGALDPVPDIPDSDRMAREVDLVNEARKWLEVFGLKLP